MTIYKSDQFLNFRIKETWIDPEKENTDDLNLNGFSAYFTSIGGRRGIGTYFKNNINFTEEVKKFNYQMSKVSSEGMDVINVSRSENALCSFVNDLDSLICTERTTYIIGDFNICYNTQKQSKVIKYLEKNGFRYVLIY